MTGSTQNQTHKPANDTVSTEGTINTQGVPPHEGTQETEDTGVPLTQQTPKGKKPSLENQPKWAVADPGGVEGAMPPPGPVKIGHKKDFMFLAPPPYPAAGSATEWSWEDHSKGSETHKINSLLFPCFEFKN